MIRICGRLLTVTVLLALTGPQVRDARAEYFLYASVSVAPTCTNTICHIDGVSPGQHFFISVAVRDYDLIGFTKVAYGLWAANPFAASYVGTSACPGFAIAANAFPDSGTVSSLVGCQPSCTVVANHEYILNAAAFIVDVLAPDLIVWDCNDIPESASCTSSCAVNAQVYCGCPAPTRSGTEWCVEDPVGTERSSWGSLRSLYR